MNKYFKWLAFFALLAGFFFGKLPSASASPQISFAGYERSIPVTGVNAYIAYKNPPVPTGTSSEWVMVGNGVHYIQAGWLKTSASTPTYFGEYQCSTVCRFLYGTVPVNTTHRYEVSISSTTWCIKIDGVCKTSASVSTIGFSSGNRALYDGEASDTTADIGGTSASHLRISTLQYRNVAGTWVGIDTALLISNTTSGTRYRASKGFSSTTFVDNWSVP